MRSAPTSFTTEFRIVGKASCWATHLGSCCRQGGDSRTAAREAMTGTWSDGHRRSSNELIVTA
eukprot:10471465-Heterocapsa_arctica.AAC.1